MNPLRSFGAVLVLAGLSAGVARAAEQAWRELFTSGLPSELAPFYERTLGWTAERLGPGAHDAVLLRRGGSPVAGISHLAGERMAAARARWAVFFEVDALVEAKAAVQRAGGAEWSAGVAASPVSGGLLFADNEGVVFGVVEKRFEPGVARGFWPVLLTREPSRAMAFYRGVFGGEAESEARTPLFPADFLLTGNGRAWAAVQPAGGGGRAGWLMLAGVGDIDAAVRIARREGARVLRGADVDLIGGRVAVLMDPLGGVFGLYEALPVKNRPVAPAPKPSAAYEVETLSP